ncbi:MAG: GNAT family N-acetyltransferase [Planctomycetota bacterium]|jgi:CelD/BcsL family acetyltransferase involved in cellulose biosynthesis
MTTLTSTAPIVSPGHTKRRRASRGHVVDVVRTTAGIPGCVPPWLALRDRLGVTAPDSSPWRVGVVIEQRSDRARPHLVRVSEGDRVVGMLIGRVTWERPSVRIGYAGLPMPRLRRLEILHGGLLVDGEGEVSNAILGHLACVLGAGEVDLVTARYLDANHPVAAALERRLASIARLETSTEAHWRLRIGEAGEPVEHRSSKTRSTFRRKERRLEASFETVRVEACRHADDVPRFLARAESIAATTYHAGLGAGVRDDGLWQAVVMSMAAAGCLRAHVLIGDGVPLAYCFGSVESDTYTLEATGFNGAFARLSPGLVLQQRLERSLRDEGVSWIDFGFGDADYKQRRGSHVGQDLTIEAYARHTWPTLGWLIDRGARCTDAFARGILARTGRLDAVRHRWRNRLAAPRNQGATT